MHRSTSVQSLGFVFAPRKAKSNSTAYYIFDKEASLMFSVNCAHFRAKNHQLSVPIITDGSAEDLNRVTNEMIHTQGTVMEMVDLFVDGANLRVDAKVAAEVYRRISNHLDAHLRELKTNPVYEPPPVDDFRNMAEFALAVRIVALDADSNIDNISINNFHNFMFSRPSMFNRDEIVNGGNSQNAAKVVDKMDSIERYLEMIGYGQ